MSGADVSAVNRPSQVDRAYRSDGGRKTCIGRRLARRLQMSFVDADEEIVKAAGAPVAEIFRQIRRSAFRESERRVIARLLNASRWCWPRAAAPIDTATRELIKQRGSPLVARRPRPAGQADARQGGRPLLQTEDPEAPSPP